MKKKWFEFLCSWHWTILCLVFFLMHIVKLERKSMTSGNKNIASKHYFLHNIQFTAIKKWLMSLRPQNYHYVPCCQVFHWMVGHRSTSSQGLFSNNTRSGIRLLTTSSVELFESISQPPFWNSSLNVFEHKTHFIPPLKLLYSLSFLLRQIIRTLNWNSRENHSFHFNVIWWIASLYPSRQYAASPEITNQIQ